MKQIRSSHLKMPQLSRVSVTAVQKLVVRCIQIEEHGQLDEHRHARKEHLVMSVLCAPLNWWHSWISLVELGKSEADGYLKKNGQLQVTHSLHWPRHSMGELTLRNLESAVEGASPGTSSHIKNVRFDELRKRTTEQIPESWQHRFLFLQLLLKFPFFRNTFCIHTAESDLLWTNIQNQLHTYILLPSPLC